MLKYCSRKRWYHSGTSLCENKSLTRQPNLRRSAPGALRLQTKWNCWCGKIFICLFFLLLHIWNKGSTKVPLWACPLIHSSIKGFFPILLYCTTHPHTPHTHTVGGSIVHLSFSLSALEHNALITFDLLLHVYAFAELAAAFREQSSQLWCSSTPEYLSLFRYSVTINWLICFVGFALYIILK